MKMLTLHQPWASLIAVGAKTIETRGWSTDYRGPLAIHAGAKVLATAWRVGTYRIGFQWANGSAAWSLCDDQVDRAWPLPFGVVVAVCDLVDVVPMVSWSPLDGPATWAAHMIPDGLDPDVQRMLLLRDATTGAEALRIDGPLPSEIDATDQLPFGDFTPGRYAWILDNVRAIDPIPCKGFQGLRDCPVVVSA